MKYSLHWLREHLTSPLPDTETLVSVVSRSAFEVEEVTQDATHHDTVLEVKVLPDRAHDALSHRGMAREMAALFDLHLKPPFSPSQYIPSSSLSVAVSLAQPELSLCYVAAKVSGVRVTESPEWLERKLVSIGARSINVIVDLTNYVMHDIGQPMHAFDADKIDGGLCVRLAAPGETMVTLDGRTLTFVGSETVIADDTGILALAGIKGGKKAEVDAHTTSIIFESAHFDATRTRRTSTLHGIKTDASKRFEHGITPSWAKEGMEMLLSHLRALQPEVEVSSLVEVGEKGATPPPIEVPHARLISRLGISLSKEEVMRLLARVRCEITPTPDGYVVVVPKERLDLTLPEHVSEEVGRLYGYDRIEGVLPPRIKTGVLSPAFAISSHIRAFCVKRGYSEVFTYSFAVESEGDVEVQNPVGKDRPKLRRALTPGLLRALESNFYQAPLIGIEDVQIFEIGHVFHVDKERLHVSIGQRAGTKKRAKSISPMFDVLVSDLEKTFGVENLTHSTPDSLTRVIEFDLGASTIDPTTLSQSPILDTPLPIVRYQPVSPFPFIVRDIAMFVDRTLSAEKIESVLWDAGGPLLVRVSQFDRFEKEGEARVSYGYRLVFQSMERTLTDREVLDVMERVTASCVSELHAEIR